MMNVCPWCDAELVWDEEIGPEDTCPHCLNELGDYRTYTVDHEALGPDSEEESDSEGGAPLSAFAREVLSEQQEWLLCLHCEQAMLHVGEQTYDAPLFRARSFRGQPLMAPPFVAHVFICPECDRMEHVLANRERQAWHERLQQPK